MNTHPVNLSTPMIFSIRIVRILMILAITVPLALIGSVSAAMADPIGPNGQDVSSDSPAVLDASILSTPTGLTCSVLQPKPATTSTGEKPQSKVWNHDGYWFAVFPTSSGGASAPGTWIWRLDGTAWIEVLKISTRTDTHADVKVDGDLAHILLFSPTLSQTITVEYGSGFYHAWAPYPALVTIGLSYSLTGTLDKDSTGKLWVAAHNSAGNIIVYHSDSPYNSWTGPIVIAMGVDPLDASEVVTAIPAKNEIGVLWSNENTRRFGFKVHVDGDNPSTWSADELPAAGTAHDNVGAGMADDHINVAVASDGTLYAAIKTGYDTAGYPKVGLLIRRPTGIWDPDIYSVAEQGTRPIVLLDEVHGYLTIIYTSSEGYYPILYKQTATDVISFGPETILRSNSFNDSSSMKANYTNEFVVIYASASEVAGQYCIPTPPTGADLSISKTDNIRLVRPGETVIYTVTAINHGPQEVIGATVTDTLPAALTSATWTCVGAGGATCTASGSGNINDTVNMPIGSSIVYSITATVDSGASGTIVNTQTISAPEGIDPLLSNNSSTDEDLIVVPGTPCETNVHLVGCWQMDENGGPSLVDGSAAFNDGEIFGGPAWVAGKVGSHALDLDGASQYALVPDDPSLDLTNQITLAAWIKPEVYATQDVVKKALSGSVNGFELSLAAPKTDGTNKKVFFRINQVTSFDSLRINSLTMYPASGLTWMHIAATFDGTTMRLYINGVLENNLVVPPGTIISPNNMPLSIGAEYNATRYYNGWLDDVRVYNQALSQYDIQSLYGNHLPVANPDPYTTNEDTALTVLSPGVLGNDTDSDGDPLTAIKVSDPANGTLVLNPNGSFTYAPNDNWNGTDSFTYKANDGKDSGNTTTVTITVEPIDDPPVLNPIGNKTVNELTLLTFTATAVNVDLDPLTFSLTGAPAGASINSSTGAFSWTPTEAQGPGSYPFNVCVSDGITKVCESITVTVNDVNTAPVLAAIGNRTNNELATLSFTASANDTDIPAQTLTFSLANGSSGSVPAGAEITSGGNFTWTPTEAQGPGTYTFDVCVSDGLLTDCETITVTVNEVNVAPVLVAIGNKSVIELTLLTFTATATDSDLPANTLTFSLVNGSSGHVPAGADITSAGVFTWTPTKSQGPDSYTFDVCVSDGHLSDCETITVTVVEFNNAPVLGPIGNKSVNELVLLSFTANATDPDLPPNTLTFSLANGTSGNVPAGASITSAGQFSWTPTEAQGPGLFTFNVCVSDGLLSDCETITVTVNEVATAPVAIGDSYIVAQNQVLTVAVPGVLVNDSDADIPADVLTAVLDTEPTYGTLEFNSDGSFTYTPDGVWLGEDTFTYHVSDGALDSNIVTVTIMVMPAIYFYLYLPQILR